MSLHNSMLTLDEKIRVVDLLIADTRRQAKHDQVAAEHLKTLKAIAADLEARRGCPRSNALGELERILSRVLQSKTRLGYDEHQLADLARHVINKWPFIRQALERFGEEGAE